MMQTLKGCCQCSKRTSKKGRNIDNFSSSLYFHFILVCSFYCSEFTELLNMKAESDGTTALILAIKKQKFRRAKFLLDFNAGRFS